MSVDEDRLPSRPLRNWFVAWHIHTGDPPEVIAKGFDLDEEIVVELLSGEGSLMMDEHTAIELCAKTRLDPRLLWPTGHLTPAWLVEPYLEMNGVVDVLSKGR